MIAHGTIAGALLLVATTAAHASAVPRLRLAQVNGEWITLERLLDDFRAKHQGHLRLIVGERALREFLDREIDDLLLVQEARRLEIDRDPRVVEQALRLRRERRVSALLQREVQDKADVPTAELERAVERQRSVHRIRLVRLTTRAEAEAALGRIDRGEPFEEVARDLSRDPSARRGGDPGPFAWGGERVALEEQVLALEPGETSGVFAERDGFTIVRLEAREALARVDEKQLERRARDVLRQRREAELEHQLTDRLLARADLTIHDDALGLESLRQAAAGEDPPRVAATIGDSRIGLAELAAAIDFEAWSALPSETFAARVRGELLASVRRMLLAEEAARLGLGGAALEAEVQATTDRATLRILLAETTHRDLEPTADELLALYREDEERHRLPDRFHLQHIVVAERAEAEALRERLRAADGPAFAAAAVEASLDRATGERGGDLGWIGARDLSRANAELFSGMAPGDLGPVLETSAGFSIVRLAEARRGELQPFEAVRASVRLEWLKRAQREERERWLARLRSEADIVVRERALRKALDFTVAEAERRRLVRSADGQP